MSNSDLASMQAALMYFDAKRQFHDEFMQRVSYEEFERKRIAFKEEFFLVGEMVYSCEKAFYQWLDEKIKGWCNDRS